jgi:hypothetical protein
MHDTRTEQDRRWFGNLGYIYVLQGEHGYFKIGKSIHPHKRRKELQTSCPFPELDVFLLFHCHQADMGKFEEFLHGSLASKRTRGEWFKLDKADLDWLDQEILVFDGQIVAQAYCLAPPCLNRHLATSCSHWPVPVPSPS